MLWVRRTGGLLARRSFLCFRANVGARSNIRQIRNKPDAAERALFLKHPYWALTLARECKTDTNTNNYQAQKKKLARTRYAAERKKAGSPLNPTGVFPGADVSKK